MSNIVNQFFINDKIKVSLNMVQKIISFSYNEDKLKYLLILIKIYQLVLMILNIILNLNAIKVN